MLMAHDDMARDVVGPPILIIGAGGHAQVLVDAIRRKGRRIAGFTDSQSSRHGKTFCGVPILGGDHLILDYAPDAIELAVGIGAVAAILKRGDIYEAFAARGYRFATVVHPTACLGETVSLGGGVQILARAVINPGAQIGRNAVVNTGAIV